jgi:Protein of unknown function (DUF4197)
MKFLRYYPTMLRRCSVVLGVFCVLLSGSFACHSASIFEQLGLKRPATPVGLSSLSEDQVVTGLKAALAAGVQHAVTNLGQPNGFLTNAQVRIPLPDSMKKVENGLRAVGQGALADEFITTMNRAAEQAVPEAVTVLSDSLKQISIADAKTILTSTNTAATDYFRRTTSTNLFARFLPIVKKATDQAGVTSAYKRVLDKSNVGGFRLGSLGGLGSRNEFDIDSYVTQKALNGLFIKIAEQERLIRENPAARTTAVLQQVFGVFNKS